MVVTILRTASEGPPPCRLRGPPDASRQADEHPPFGPEEAASRLDDAHPLPRRGGAPPPRPRWQLHLDRARPGGAAEHPEGFDTADLWSTRVRPLPPRPRAPPPPVDARTGGYDQGFYAYWTGETPADNPHAPDSADHLAWETAGPRPLDEDFRWTGPRFAAKPGTVTRQAFATLPAPDPIIGLPVAGDQGQDGFPWSPVDGRQSEADQRHSGEVLRLQDSPRETGCRGGSR